MKKKTVLIIIAIVILLGVLFIPMPKSPYKDGGTREYSALTYKIVDWNRLTEDGVYEATKVYWFPNNLKSIDTLWETEEQNITHRFVATVLELSSTCAIVQPLVATDELYLNDQVSVNIAELGEIDVQVGSCVDIYFTGGVMETYPLQVHAVKWELHKTLRHKEYTEQWLDQKTAEKQEENLHGLIVITEIYANCFFARTAIPGPYTIKLNGQLSEDYCVGDQVLCTYENLYCDAQDRVEGDLLTVETSEWSPESWLAAKPVLYLYPEIETKVSVKLNLDGRLTCTYPAYRTGWEVIAAPDGTLTNAKGQIFNYLYWEGETNAAWDMTQGFCIKGKDTAAFLEWALDELGLTRREANEFIVYWLPLMEQNPYNIISFQTDVYTEAAALQIDPAPDTLIRVFMAWKAADAFVELPPQELTAPERTGFTVVEWGGTEVCGVSEK